MNCQDRTPWRYDAGKIAIAMAIIVTVPTSRWTCNDDSSAVYNGGHNAARTQLNARRKMPAQETIARLASGTGKIARGLATSLALIAFFGTGQVRAQTQCPVIGSASTWGFPGTGYFDVSPGGACLFSLNVQGEILSSTISTAPSNGRLNMVNVSTYTYTPNPGFSGTDAFAIEATGKSIGGPVGTSLITMNATVR